MYTLDNGFIRNRYAVTVVGCGGTGGFVAEKLCRILPANTQLVLIDPDRVEERNLTRQNFTREDLRQIKSEALARRLARRYVRPISYVTFPIGLVRIETPGLVIGCVDNGLARKDIAAKFKRPNYNQYGSAPSWWIDAGNGENYGQVLIGNSDGKGKYAITEEGKFMALPLPTIQRPDLLAQVTPNPLDTDCAQVAEQGPTVNQAMAALVVEVVRRLIAGSCRWMQLYLDLESGTLQPVFANMKVKKLSEIKK